MIVEDRKEIVMKHIDIYPFKNIKDRFTGNENKTPQEKMIEEGKIKVQCEIKYNKNNPK